MSCSKSKMLQQCVELADVLREVDAVSPSYDPTLLKQKTPKLVSVVAALRGEANALPPQHFSTVEAAEALKQCVVRFLQLLKTPQTTPESVKAGVVEIAMRLREALEKIKGLPDDQPGTLPTSTNPTSPPSHRRPPLQTTPIMVASLPQKIAFKPPQQTHHTPPSPMPKSFLSSSGSPPSSPSRTFMDFPIPVRQVMKQRDEVKTTLTALIQAHKESNLASCKEEEEKLLTQVKDILSIGNTGGCDMSSSILPLVEKLCSFSENVGYSPELVSIMSELNMALKDLAQAYKNFNKERAKSGGGPLPVPMPVGLASSSGNSGNVQILVSELKGLVQEGDPLMKYNLMKKVGEGASGSVWKAEIKHEGSSDSSGEIVAIKKVELSVKTIESTLKEIRFMSDIHHPNALEYRECWLPKGEVWIVMEFCDGGSVSDILEKLGKPLEEKCIAAVAAQSVSGLEYLHSKLKIHRDIKAANLLLTIQGQVKIADFGTSAEGSARTTVIGTFMWMAPETIDARGHDSKADIWSLGITLVEMAELYPPYWHLRSQPRQVAQAILREPPPTLKEPRTWSPEFVEVISLCLQKDPVRRPTAANLLKHPFMKDTDNNSIVELLQRANEAPPASTPTTPGSTPSPSPSPLPSGPTQPAGFPLKSPHMVAIDKSGGPRPSKTLPRQSGKYRSGTYQPVMPEGGGAKEIPIVIALKDHPVGRNFTIQSTTTAAQLIQKCAHDFQDIVPSSDSQSYALYFAGLTTAAEFKIPEHVVVWNTLQTVWSKTPEAEARFLWK